MRHVIMSLLALAPLAAVPAAAEPMRATFATWVRAAPDRHSPSLEELDAGAVVEVLGCGGGWCRVGPAARVGYVPQSLLSATAAPVLAPSGDCAYAIHATPAGPIRLRLCLAAPQP
jgi:hypothetical protein